MNPLNSVRGTIIAGIVLAVVIAFFTGGVGVDLNEFSLIIWIHVMAGITWIGLLYYFNFVQVPALAEAASDQGGPGGAGISKYVAPRALWWFRWGAVVTWLSGAAYLWRLGIIGDAFMLGLNSGAPANAYIIGVGAWLGTIMLFNVWVLIWPNQKKILGIVEASAEEIGKARRVAFLASRTNTLLSIPMLMSMVGYGHAGFFL
ncbi:MAG TPA: urate hydroxylase PuuD [Gammaproteobacteria bacterium]|nr:urate hydroxylase PuuD [Gammaproteobacteria bacterium]